MGKRPYSTCEEIANSVTHGLGVIFAVGALTSLLVLASYFGTTTHIVSYLLYGIALIALYTASTLYHALPQARAKRFFKVCDHAAIYLLIAGTYTPFLLLHLSGGIKWISISAIWTIAMVGVIFKLFFTGKFKGLSTALYIAMGWMIIFIADYFNPTLNQSAMNWLIIGGVTYTLGTVLYMLKQYRYTHAIWHGFVLLGSIFHFVAILHAGSFQY